MVVVPVTGLGGDVYRLAPDKPLVLESSGRVPFFWFRVFDGSAEVLARFGAGTPLAEWFGGGDQDGKRSVGSGGIKRGVNYFDGRLRVEQGYRVENRSDRPWVVKRSENERPQWFTATCCLTTLALPVGIAWLGLWLVRRLARRRTV